MDSWERFDEVLLPDMEDQSFYSDQNMEDIAYVDYMHAKEVYQI